MPSDPDAVARTEASAALSNSHDAVSRLRREGLLREDRGGRKLYSRHEVELYVANPWLTGKQAAYLLGVSRVRISQLASSEKVAVHLTASSKRRYRKLQLQAV
jgi:hypothetical protein